MARKRKSLPPLTPRGRHILATILNAVAFGTHDDLGDGDALAEKLGTTAGRLRTMLRKMEAMGYVTMEGKVTERVLPTIAAICWQNPKTSECEAAALIPRLR